MRKAKLTVVACATLLWAGTALAATPEQNCQKARVQAQGKYQLCVDNVLAKLYVPTSVDTYKALWKCRHTYFKKWTGFQPKAALAGSSCIGSRFTDNGATVTDNLSGLVWEKKTDDGGATVHDKNLTWVWSDNPPAADGSAFTSLLAPGTSGLNVVGFAGQYDWRLPTLSELQTILQDFPCTGAGFGATCICSGPCIEASFNDSNTQSGSYWSATALGGSPALAWIVDFSDASLDIRSEPNGVYVRAVRGGL